MDVLLVLNKLVAHLLIEICAAVAELGQELDRFHNEVETVYVVLYTYIERCCDRTFLTVTPYVHPTVVVTSVSKLVNE